MKKLIQLLTIIFISKNIILAQNYLLPDVAISQMGNHIVINIPNLSLYLYSDGVLKNIYPTAVGKKATPTPNGEYKIGIKIHNPIWYVPTSIQKERKQKGLPPIQSIPPGPNNPLGPIFIRFGEDKLGLGIHGTNSPSSIPGLRSHGCVRIKNQHIQELNHIIQQNDFVTITYQLYALNVDENNELWFQKYNNPYQLKDHDIENIKDTIKKWEEMNHITIDSHKLAQLLKKKQFKPSCLTCVQKNPLIHGSLKSLAWTNQSPAIRNPKTLETSPLLDNDKELAPKNNLENENSSLEFNLF